MYKHTHQIIGEQVKDMF